MEKLLLFAVQITVIAIATGQGPLVSTKFGLLRGLTLLDRYNRTFEEFRGVRYSNNPGRFEYSQPQTAWTGERLAQEEGDHCPQFPNALYPFIGYGGNTSEDCLHLNVHIPGRVRDHSNAKLPVMFFIYGGAFVLGTSRMYRGHELALDANVVVVVVNFRISSLGFLSTGDSNAPGNYALFDVIQALRWVKDNIRAFGGDPDRVTLFGQSAGAAMTMLTSISPLSKGLFHRSIAISGTADRMYTKDQSSSVKLLAQHFNCSTNSSKEIIDCLKKVNAVDLEEASTITLAEKGHIPNWQPVQDGRFLPAAPRDMITRGALANISLITGNTYHDSASFVLNNLIGWPSNTSDEGNWCVTLNATETLVKVINERYKEEILSDMYRLYPRLRSADLLTRSRECVDFVTDELFASPTDLEASLHAQYARANGTTFKYMYQYRPSFLMFPWWVNGTHVSDLYPTFGEIFLEAWVKDILGNEWNDLDRRKHREHASYFGNFAHTGNPNNGPHTVPAMWPIYDQNSKNLLHITNHNNAKQESANNRERFSFWNSKTRRLDVPINGVNPSSTSKTYFSLTDMY